MTMSSLLCWSKSLVGCYQQLYEKEHEHRIGKDGWTVEDHLHWRQEYAPPILKKLRKALLRVQTQMDKYPPNRR